MNNPGYILDKLRNDLGNTSPELEDIRWNLAKTDISTLIKRAGPFKTGSVSAALLLIGGIFGVYVVKKIPKMLLVKYVKYCKEVFKAQSRLSKIAIEEYERIDEAIEMETQFLNMMGHDIRFEVSFSVSEDHSISFHIANKPKKTSDE